MTEAVVAIIRLPVSPVRMAPGTTLFPSTYADERNGQRVTRPLPRLRLRVHLIVVGPEPGKGAEDERWRSDNTSVLLDTGAPISLFPRWAWEQFENHITRLPSSDEEVEARHPDLRTPRMSVGGGECTSFLGRVRVAAIDPEDRHMPAVEVLALFREDSAQTSPRPPILLGLWGGILEGRDLQRVATLGGSDPDRADEPIDNQQWWLIDLGR